MATHPFELFNLDSKLIEAIKDLKFDKPTEIQNRIIPRIKKRRKFNRSISNRYREIACIFITVNR